MTPSAYRARHSSFAMSHALAFGTEVPAGTRSRRLRRLPDTRILAFVCLTHDRGLKFRDVISALRY